MQYLSKLLKSPYKYTETSLWVVYETQSQRNTLPFTVTIHLRSYLFKRRENESSNEVYVRTKLI